MRDNAQLADDLFEINRRICCDIWNLCAASDKPSGLSPRLIFPKEKDDNLRITEQEAKILCCSVLNSLNYFYSVETPTREKYQQKGESPTCGHIDLSLYNFENNQLEHVANVEFKYSTAPKEIAKDIEKLIKEGIHGNWFHTLKSINKRTFPKLFDKFTATFRSFSDTFSDKNISIVFCFCVLEKQKAYIRHFLYDPQICNYEDYTSRFFEPSDFPEHWQSISREGLHARPEKAKSEIQKPTQKERVRMPIGEIPRWERASMLEDCFDLQLTNPAGLDIDRCRQLVEALDEKDGIHPPHFNKDASKEFHRWLSNLNTPLREQAYARLSNWFLTDKEFCRNSPLGQVALELWNTLFCSKPDIRLTNPKRDHKILRERFVLWWPSQLDCQKKGRASIQPEGESADYYNSFIRLWEECPDFTIAPGTKGYSAKHKGNARIWVFKKRLQVAPESCNRLNNTLCEILHEHFPSVGRKATLPFDLAALSSDTLAAFVSNVKTICKQHDC